MESQTVQKRANLVLLACILMNISVGGLYAWSVFKAKLMAPLDAGGWAWSSQQAGFPYTIAIIFTALGILVGGRIQDKIGPRLVLTAGGAMMGTGLVLSGLAGNSPGGITLYYGIISAFGVGFGYGCATPPALKWFHPSKKGLVSGLIVGGFGISAVCIAPLASVLLSIFGIKHTFIILGVIVGVVSVSIAQLVKNPPAGYVPEAPPNWKPSSVQSTANVDITWKEMVRTKRFYLMFTMYLISSSVGLMIIGNIAKIAQTQIGIANTALIVVFLAIANTGGRVIGGMMSDKIGRLNALFVVFTLQALNMVGFVYYQTLAGLLLGVLLVGFCFGTPLSVFPAATADLYGLKNFGMNYGVLFLAWGLAGVVTPLIADIIYDISGNFYAAYVISAVMMASLIYLNILLRMDLKKK